MSTYALIGTSEGIVRTRDYRTLPENRWNKKLLMDVNTTFEEYIVPNAENPEAVVIVAGPADVNILPPIPVEFPRARRLRLGREDFVEHGFTAGCSGCISIQENRGISRNHTEACRA